MFAVTERQGSSAVSWNAIPRSPPRRSSAGLRPLTRAVPSVASSSPARIRRTVDLPQPEGPSSEPKLPAAVCSVTSSSAVTVRRPVRNRLVSPLMS
jgi:hypothetical protein